jgi:hypothetical protein
MTAATINRTAPWRLCPWWTERESVAVPTVEPPSAAEFRARHLRRERPVVLGGLASRWSAARAWTPDALAARFGDREVPLMRLVHGVCEYEHGSGVAYERGAVGPYVESLRRAPSPERFLSVRVEPNFPELADELGPLEYLSGARWRDARISIGAEGTTTPIHVELAHNLLAVVHGEKELALFPPWQSRRLYFRPFSAAPHISPVDPYVFDRVRFPRAVRATPWRALLRSGDVLFLPRGWWHAVRTNGMTVAYSSWWADGASSLVTRAAGLYKRLRDLRT